MWRLLFVLYQLAFASGEKIDSTELKCLVCEKTMQEIQTMLAKVDPNAQVDAGGYRLDAEGNLRKKTVSQADSEVFLSDLLEKVCNTMDDYVRARWKSSQELTLVKLIGDDGKMSFDVGNVDIVQDADLNKSLKYYCEMLIEEHEEEIIKTLVSRSKHMAIEVCSLTAGYCNQRLPQDEL